MNLFRSTSPSNRKEIKEEPSKLKLHAPGSPIDSSHSNFVFLKHALEQINSLKEVKRVSGLKEAIQKATDRLTQVAQSLPAAQANEPSPKLNEGDLDSIAESLLVACGGKQPAIQTIALDCIGKCFTYHFWGNGEGLPSSLNAPAAKAQTHVLTDDDSPPVPIYPDLPAESALGYPSNRVIPRLVETMCGCFQETDQGDEKVQLMLVKSLLAAVSCTNPASALHGEMLVKAIRTTFRIFLLSKSSNAQIIAQATLTQMCQAVFSKCPGDERLFAILKGQDAFHCFGLLYELSNGPVSSIIADTDVKSVGIRSKLLALHLLNAVLTLNPNSFVAPTGESTILINDVKPYLCVLLSRNASNIVPPVMEVSMELTAKVLLHYRQYLKAEVSLLWSQLVLPMVEGKRGITFAQRLSMVRLLHRIATDTSANPSSMESGAKFIVEMYLNYDCDLGGGAHTNYVERLFTSLSKVISSAFNMSPSGVIGTNLHSSPQAQASLALSQAGNSHIMASASQGLTLASTLTAASQALQASSAGANSKLGAVSIMPPAFTSQNLGPLTKDQLKDFGAASGDSAVLARQALETLVGGILRALSVYLRSTELFVKAAYGDATAADEPGGTKEAEGTYKDEPSVSSTPSFAQLKQKKQALGEGIAKFNWKPKKGVEYWLGTKLIASNTPEAIGAFLHDHFEELDKRQLGEYLGEGEEFNIQVMRAFVLQFNFTNLGLVSALRLFLRSFHLPGESQKIDRFMLQFADSYVKQNPEVFASGDTAYVLSYSVIMLNTDQHNPQVKRRMNKEEFVRNNRGIDNGADLPKDLLESIFVEISTNEIKMNKNEFIGSKAASEQAASARKLPKDKPLTETVTLSVTNILSNSVDSNREWFECSASENAQNVGSLLETVWMSLLTSLSAPFQQSDDPELVCLSLDGLRFATHLACVGGLALPRQAFVSTLHKFTQLGQVQDMRPKNVEAVKALLFVGLADGNGLDSNWANIFSTIIRLERLNALGAAGASAIPVEIVSRAAGNRPLKYLFLEDNLPETSSATIVKTVDRLYVETVKLSGPAIVQFVTHLCQTSLEEINEQLHGNEQNSQPRLYSLQKLVEISYYNMRRIRLEWSQVWAVLGEHFNTVGSTNSVTIAIFVLDKLRQLSLKFLEMEELAQFKFQREFLKPFQRILQQNNSKEVHDMVLISIQQIIQSRAARIASGWSVLLQILAQCAGGTVETLLKVDFDIIKSIGRTYLPLVIRQGAFSDLVSCITAVANNNDVQRYHIPGLELLRDVIPRACSELDKPTAFEALWKSSFTALVDLALFNADLEVRSRALQIFFSVLQQNVAKFSSDMLTAAFDSWLLPLICATSEGGLDRELLDDAKGLWLSTTYIQALRLFVEFYVANVTLLRDRWFPQVFNALTQCLLYKDESIARIGSACLVEFVHGVQRQMSDSDWDKLGVAFEKLIDETLPRALFDSEYIQNLGGSFSGSETSAERVLLRRKAFSKVVQQSVLHLVSLQTLQDVLQNDINLLMRLESRHVYVFCSCFERSFEFAKRFNNDLVVRQSLLELGFMRQLPHLLKQETCAASGLLGVLIRVLTDSGTEVDRELSEYAASHFFPLALDILIQFNQFDLETKQRHIQHWRPIVCDILDAQADIDDALFAEHLPKFFIEFTHLMLQDTSVELRTSLCSLMIRTGLAFNIIKDSDLLEKYSESRADGNSTAFDKFESGVKAFSAQELQDAYENSKSSSSELRIALASPGIQIENAELDPPISADPLEATAMVQELKQANNDTVDVGHSVADAVTELKLEGKQKDFTDNFNVQSLVATENQTVDKLWAPVELPVSSSNDEGSSQRLHRSSGNLEPIDTQNGLEGTGKADGESSGEASSLNARAYSEPLVIPISKVLDNLHISNQVEDLDQLDEKLFSIDNSKTSDLEHLYGLPRQQSTSTASSSEMPDLTVFGMANSQQSLEKA